jgi:hypothetical protein
MKFNVCDPRQLGFMRFNVPTYILARDIRHYFWGWIAETIGNNTKLVDVILSREERDPEK